MKGIIVIWGGAIGDIPGGWHLCDGSTVAGVVLPDLRDKFIIGAGNTYAVDETAPTNVATDTGIAYYALAYIVKL